MALLTLPATPQKDAFQTYGLNQADLLSLVADNYFLDKNNWKKVVITYTSTVSNQLSIISFNPDIDIDEVSALGFFSEEARSSFRLQNISIYDQQNGRLRLERSEIPSVASYDILFSDEISGAWYNMVGANGSMLTFTEDGSRLLAGTTSTAYYGAEAFSGVVLDAQSGEVNNELSKIINNYKVMSFFVTGDESKVFVAGKFGLSYMGSSLPPLTTGSEYAADPIRLLSIDVASNTVTWITDIKEAGAFSGMSANCFSLYVDELQDVAIVAGQSLVVGYSLSSGESLWSKQYSITAGSQAPDYLRRMIEYNGDILIAALSYDGNTQTSPVIRRINKLTGNDTNLLPVQLGSLATYWDVTPDKSKIVITTTSSAQSYCYYDGTSWSSSLSIGFGTLGLVVENSAVYFQDSSRIRKRDYSGALVTSFGTNGTASIASLAGCFIAAGGNGFFLSSNPANQLKQFDLTTGIVSSSFKGVNVGAARVMYNKGSNLYMVANKGSNTAQVIYTLPGSSFVDSNSTGIINTTDASLSKILPQDGLYNYFSSGYVVSSLYDDLIFYPSTRSIIAYDTVSESAQSGWPTYTGVGGSRSFSNIGIIDGFLYIVNPNDPGSNPQYTDSLGTFSFSTAVARIDLATKTFDRSFGVNFPGNIRGTAFISSSSNYVYFSGNASTDTPALVGVFRMRKSDSFIEALTPASMGLSMASFNTLVRLNFVEIESNKLVIYCDKNSSGAPSTAQKLTALDGKPYIVVTEDTLSQSYPQPAQEANPDINVNLVFNPEKMELGGIVDTYVSFSTYRRTFLSYNLVDNVQSIGVDVSGTNPDFRLNIAFNPSAPTISLAVKDGDYYMFVVGTTVNTAPYIYNSKPYLGVIKMSSIGVISA